MNKILKVLIFAWAMCAISAFATNWTGGGSDKLFDPKNWGGVDLGTENDAVFSNSGDLSLRLADDYEARRMFFYGKGHVAIDLAGNNLAFKGGDVQVNSTDANAEFYGGGKVSISGTLRISSGAANNCSMLIRDSGTFVYPNAMLIGQSSGGSFNTLIVSNGAHFAVNNGIPLANAGGNSISSNNCIVVTGQGSEVAVSNAASMVEIGWQACGGNNFIDVRDHGLLYCAKTVVGSQTNSYNNSLLVHSYGIYTNCGDFVIGNLAGASSNHVDVTDNGWLYVKDNFSVSATASTGNVFTVSSARAYVGKTLTIAGNDASFGNEIRVLDGGMLEVGGRMNMGWTKHSDDNRVILSNGTLRVERLFAGLNDTEAEYAYDNRFVFCGEDDTIVVTGNDISLKSGATIEVDFPEEGRDPTVTCLEGLSANLNLDGTMRIIVNAQRHVRKLEQRTTYPLVRVNGQVAATALDHVSVDDPDHVSVELAADGKGIDIVVKPGRKGLTVVIR